MVSGESQPIRGVSSVDFEEFSRARNSERAFQRIVCGISRSTPPSSNLSLPRVACTACMTYNGMEAFLIQYTLLESIRTRRYRLILLIKGAPFSQSTPRTLSLRGDPRHGGRAAGLASSADCRHNVGGFREGVIRWTGQVRGRFPIPLLRIF